MKYAFVNFRKQKYVIITIIENSLKKNLATFIKFKTEWHASFQAKISGKNAENLRV